MLVLRELVGEFLGSLLGVLIGISSRQALFNACPSTSSIDLKVAARADGRVIDFWC